MKCGRLGAACAIIFAIMPAGCSSGSNPGWDRLSPKATQASKVPAPGPGSKVTNNLLTVQVMGTCNDVGGMWLQSSGFTPNSEYRTTAQYPGGQAYNHLQNDGIGMADENGRATDWRWDCAVGANGQSDPPGVYTATIEDIKTHRMVTITFPVSYDQVK